MTTVAWDGQTLAGDTLGVVAGYLRQRARKVHKLPDGRLIGGAGNYAELLQVLVWLTDDESEEPSLEDFAGLLVQPDGRAFVFSEDRVMIPLLEARYAIGSGRDFALSAMWYGATAAEAVRHASQFDVWTGPEVEIIQL
jgi:ATP-dependent protease HslVU (ClpYQ) peptidase subunit